MSANDPLSAIGGSASGATAGAAKPRDRLGQEQFLELMIAQMQNQDPFKPVEPGQFLGQLAQFGTVSGIQDMQGSIAALADALRGAQVLDGATLVGRRVLAEGEHVALGTGGAVRGAFEAPAGTSSVTVSVHDSSGQLVRRLQLPATSGIAEFEWDGNGERGERAAPGNYRISAVASVGGQSESLPTLVESRIESVTLDAGGRGLTLNTHQGPLALADVRRVM